MRKFRLLAVLTVAILLGKVSVGQDFSNKGKDFWVAYGYHEQMNNGGGGSQDMRLYFSAELAANVTVSIPGIGYSQTYSVPANSTIASNIIPKNAPQDARLLAESTVPENKGIHITSDKAIVAYAHIYNGSVSGATILFPTPTLGKEYYSVNYDNISNVNNSNCWFYVVAADIGTTTVSITPSAPTINHPAGVPFTITMTQGQVYQVMGTFSNTTSPRKGVDLSGSKIQSISANGEGCKRIAVFSGSGRISITCNGNSSSSDNYMVQAFPKSAWGRRFLTVPSVDYNTPNATTTSNSAANIYRICVSDPTTVVTINGVVTTLPLISNFYYELPSSLPGANSTGFNLIETDKPVVVAQYFPSRGSCGMTNPGGNGDGDPEVIYLSPVEQNINKVLWNANAQANINQNKHFINVVIPNAGTAITSFRLDGVTVPASNFVVHPQSIGYAYARINVTSTPGGGANIGLPHVVQSDSGFNAIAYGYGAAESYGYNAGTNVKDLYQQIGVSTQYGIEPTPSVCKGSPFRFKVSLPYCADSIQWDLSQLPGPPAAPLTQIYTTCTPGSGGPDSTTVVNGKTIFWYSLPAIYTFNISGAFPVTISAFAPNAEGCGNEQEIPFDLNVYDPPIADFNWTGGGCVAEAVQFNDITTTPRPSYIWNWSFLHVPTGTITTSTVQNPLITFAAPGAYDVTFSTITTPGCISQQITKQVIIAPIPSATITDNATVCINSLPEPVITFTATDGKTPYTFTYNINGGGSQTISTTGTNTSVTLPSVPTNVAGTFRYNLTEVKNSGSTLCVRPITNTFVDVVVNANVGIALTSGSNTQSVCQNTAIGNITYTLSGGGDNATVAGLPAGVNGVYDVPTKTFVISGTPTAPGTYPYTVTATGPCLPSNLTGTITVNPDASISLSGSNTQSLCINTLVSDIAYTIGGGGTGATVSGLPAGVTGTYSGGVFTITGSPTVTGTFNYTVQTTGTCVQTSATGTITVNPDATLSLTSAAATTSQSVCESVAITNITYAIGGGGTDATVSGLPAGINFVYNAGVLTISGSSVAVGTYPFAVQTTGTCVQRTATGTITINPDASISLTSVPTTNAQELCRNSTLVNITYAIAGGGTGGTVSGLPAGVTGTFSSGVFTISGAPTVAGTFNYTVNTTGTCVQKNATGTITVNQLPTGNFNFTAPSCATRTISFTDLSTPNSGNNITWLWDFGDATPVVTINAPASPNITHSYPNPGSYIVSLTVTTDKGCVSNPVFNTPVVIKPRPQAGFIVPEVCINDAATVFTDTSRLVGDTWDAAGYEWNFGDPGSGAANTSTTLHGSHLYTAIGPYVVTHIVTSSSGCKDTVVSNIFINAADPVSDFNIATPANLCSNDSVSLINRSTISQGNVTKLEIYWDVVGAPGVFETIDVPVFNGVYKHKYPTVTTTQSYTIRMIAYSGNICFTNKTSPITVNAAPRVQFLPISNVCFDAAAFQITSASELGTVPGTPTYSGPGVSATGVFTPSSVVPGSTNTIKYLYTSTAAGCRDSATQTITVWDTASARITVALITCEKNSIAFNSSASTIPAGAGTITGWNWNFGDPGSGVNNTSTNATPSHTFNNWGNYNITLQVSTSNNCRSTVSTMPVTVNPLPRPNFTKPASVCLPSATVAFNIIAPTMPDGSTPQGYLWDFDDPASGALNTATSSSPSHIYNTVGPFDVNLEVTSNNGCVHDTTIAITTIHPQPLADFTINKPEVCIGDGFTFTDNTNYMDGVAGTYSWTMKDGNIRAIRTFPYTYTTAGTYDVELFTINSHGCRSTTFTKPVTVHPYPVVAAGPNRLLLEGGQITLDPIVTGNDLSYLWTPNQYITGLNTVRNLVVNGIDDIRYLLTVTARGNCSDTSSVFIKVLKFPAIPNIFSPNGDGVHDKWIIDYLDTYPGSTVDIYNRYGQQIFHSVGYTTPWDGTVNGKPVPVGTYYYIVDPKNGRKLMTGYVDVIR